MAWYLGGIRIDTGGPVFDMGDARAPELSFDLPRIGDRHLGHPSNHLRHRSHHYPGHRREHGVPSATHGHYPGHRHAIKRYERERGQAKPQDVATGDEQGPFWDPPPSNTHDEQGPFWTPPHRRDREAHAGEGRGSVFGRHKGKYDWTDKGGITAMGETTDQPGIALYSRRTLGQWFDVKDPEGRIHRLRQIDVGPDPSTGRKIDITAAAAEQMGYSPTDFPTDQIFGWKPINRGGGEHRHFPGHGHIPSVSRDDMQEPNDTSGGELPGAGNTSHLNPEFKSRLRRMFADAPSAFSVTSGYRSTAHQAELYRRSGGSSMVARPGHSMHERGLAADIAGPLEWAHEHAHEYGLHFPMSYERWHIEPTGVHRGAARDVPKPHEGDPFGVQRMQEQSKPKTPPPDETPPL